MLIALTGRLRSGKDTFAKRLIADHGFVRHAFADALKDLCAYAVQKEDLGWTGTDWSGDKTPLGRQILQGVGHGARQVIDPSIWVHILTRRVNEALALGTNVVVTDVRYQNELDALHRLGAISVRITRPGIDRSGPAHQHETETQIDDLGVHLDVTNGGTVDDLWAKADMLVAVRRVLSVAQVA